MVDSLAMFFGAKKRPVKRSPARKVTKSPAHKSAGTVVVRGKERKLHKGKNGGLYYKTKTGRAYVDAKFVRSHQVSPKRTVRRASPKRTVRRASPKRTVRRASPVNKMRVTRWGYGLGQPSLLDMMGPAGLTVMPQAQAMMPQA